LRRPFETVNPNGLSNQTAFDSLYCHSAPFHPEEKREKKIEELCYKVTDKSTWPQIYSKFSKSMHNCEGLSWVISFNLAQLMETSVK